MRIPYQKKRNPSRLLGFVLWGLFAFYGLFISENTDWTDYASLLISIAYLSLFLFEKKVKYLTILDGKIKSSGLLGKQIQIDELIEIKNEDSEILVRDKRTKLIINKALLSDEELSVLLMELKEQNEKGQ